MIHGTKAVIRSYQGFTDGQSLLSVESVEHHEGCVRFTASVSEEIFPSIMKLLDGGLTLVRWIETQNRVKKAISRGQNPVEQEKRMKQYLDYERRVLKEVDDFIDSGCSPREAIRKTKELLKSKGIDITCSIIELMFNDRRKRGRKL